MQKKSSSNHEEMSERQADEDSPSSHFDDCRLLGHQAARPLHALPYYHGTIGVMEASALVQSPGEFLIFLDKEDKQTCLIFIDKDGLAKRALIKSTDKGFFYIREDDTELRFTIIEHMIEYYVAYSEPIDNRSTSCLKHPIHDSQKVRETLVEHCKSIKFLSYYYGLLTDGQVQSLLKFDGDYLIRQVKGESRKVLNQVCVRWGEQIKYVFETSASSKPMLYLPRSADNEPVETVSKLDHLLKSYVNGQCIVNGVQLKRAVHDEGKMKTNINRRRTTDEISRLLGTGEMNVRRYAMRLPSRDYGLINFKSPRPMHSLPYYHGVIEPPLVNLRLDYNGDFLVYINKDANQLSVAAFYESGSIKLWTHADISCSAETGYFWIRPEDEMQQITSLEILIAYYKEYRIPVQTMGLNCAREKDEVVECCLSNAVMNPNYFENAKVEYKRNAEELPYHCGYIAEPRVRELLKKSGDYILREDENKRAFVSVYWEDELIKYYLPFDKEWRRYVFPKKSPDEPKESTYRVDHFIKSLVRCQYSIGGAVLKASVNVNRTGNPSGKVDKLKERKD